MKRLHRNRLIFGVWILIAGLWGCASQDRQQSVADRCASQGGTMVGNKCQVSSESPQTGWSERQMREIQRGFQERQPGSGRLY
jgi:hypothetical protein